MVALVDDERVLRDRLRVELVRVEQVDELRLCCRRFLRGYETSVVRSRPRDDLVMVISLLES